MTNWKAPGKDGVQGLHGRIAEQLNNTLNKEELPEWLTFGRTILCLKDHSKGNAVDNFRPISCPFCTNTWRGVYLRSRSGVGGEVGGPRISC